MSVLPVSCGARRERGRADLHRVEALAWQSSGEQFLEVDSRDPRLAQRLDVLPSGFHLLLTGEQHVERADLHGIVVPCRLAHELCLDRTVHLEQVLGALAQRDVAIPEPSRRRAHVDCRRRGMTRLLGFSAKNVRPGATCFTNLAGTECIRSRVLLISPCMKPG